MRRRRAPSRISSTRREQVGGGLLQRAAAGLLRLQLGGGAGDDELADLVDELIELVGVDADQARFLGLSAWDWVSRLCVSSAGVRAPACTRISPRRIVSSGRDMISSTYSETRL
jgi:hypothetical protein